MHKADRKMAVLLAVKEHKGEIAFPDLLILLKNKFAERSVRRWLHELTEEGFIKKSGQKKGTRYQAIIKEDRVPLILDSLFSESSTNAISYVTQPIYLRKPTGYNFNWLEAYEPNKTFYLTKQRRTLLKQEGERRYQQDIAGTYARHIYNRLMIDLSYNSSRLEGNTYSLIETEKLILEGDVQIDKLNDETVMILNHKEAIRYLVDNAAQLNIEPHIIFTLHYLLADGLLPAAMTGIVRDHGVKIGGSTYLPSDNKQKLEDILSILCKKAAQIFPFNAYCLFASI